MKNSFKGLKDDLYEKSQSETCKRLIFLISILKRFIYNYRRRKFHY